MLLLPLMARVQQLGGKDSVPVADTTGQSRLAPIITSSDTSVSILIQRVEKFTAELNQYNYTLKRGFDTSFITDEMPSVEEDLLLIKEDINSYNKRMNLRNLHVTRVILDHMQLKLKEWQGDLFRYYNQLVSMNLQLMGMRKDSIIRNLPADSTLKSLYFAQLVELKKKWVLADSVNKVNLKSMGLLQNRVANYYLQSNDLLEEINYRIKTFGREIFKNHDGYILSTSPAKYSRTFSEVVGLSFRTFSSVLKYYMPLSWGYRILSILLGIGFYFWIISNIRKIRRHSPDAAAALLYADFLPKFPIVSTLVFIFTIAPILQQRPPAAYSLILGVLLFLLLTNLLWLDWPKKLHRYWIFTGGLYLVSSFSNLLIENSFVERWLILAFSVTAIIVSIYFLKEVGELPLKYPHLVRFLVWMLISMNAVSLFANVFGRFALSKMLATSSILNFFQAIDLTIFVDLIMSAIYLQSEAGKLQTGGVYYFDYTSMRSRLRSTLMIIAGAFWAVSFSQALNFYDIFYDWAKEFLNKQRAVGNTSFSFGSILVFIIVIWIASILSKLIAYFFSDKPQPGGIKKTRLGNLMLVVRLGVFTAGVLFAFAASGIPANKLAIVIGALGVGIGFGLQNIVNNLVSGVILAFEKPIQIGDIIEVGTRQGVVKEIGIRSSKLSTYDGSDVIIPNGDLLSQHLVNWTLTNRNRRIEITVGVEYGADLAVTRKVLEEAVQGKPDIMIFPRPLVLINNFGENSVDFKIYFWTSDIGRWSELKSEVMDSIYSGLNLAGINIPYPQRDLHIKSLDEKLWNGLKKEGDGSHPD